MNEYHKRLREYRKYKGLSIRKCAELLEISPTYLSRLEDPMTPPPSDKVIQKILEVLGLNIEHTFSISARERQLRIKIKYKIMQAHLETLKEIEKILEEGKSLE